MNQIKFEVISKFKKDKEICLPKRSTKDSAGYDFKSAQDIIIKPYNESHKVYMIETGIKASMPTNTYLQLSNRSSTGTKKLLVNPNGIGNVDADYYNNDSNEGHIKYPIINIGNKDYHIKKGDRLFQGIFLKYYIVDDDGLSSKNYRTGGFGSSDQGE